MQMLPVVKWGVLPPCPGAFSAGPGGGNFSACGRSDFFAAEKIAKKPPKPAVLESLSDCRHRWPPSGAPCQYVASLLALTRSFIEARLRASSRRRLLYL